MNFIKHSNLEGQHAFLGASKYSWLNDTPEKLAERYLNFLSVQRGTELHALAAKLIKNGIKLQSKRKTLNMYVNDAINLKMHPEQVLYYSDNCFGTADAISFKEDFLRIHDLKTGKTPAHIEQLEIYAALFCLEYGINPRDIKMELRIYQSDEIIIYNPTEEEIETIMETIIRDDKIITQLKIEEDL